MPASRGGLRVGADRVQLAAAAVAAQVVAGDDQRPRPARSAPATGRRGRRRCRSRRKRRRQVGGVDLLAAGPEVVDAAEDVERAERDHQRRHPAEADQHAVDQPAARAPSASPASSSDDDRQARVVAAAASPTAKARRPRTEPTDRSMLRVITTTAWPTASTARIVAFEQEVLDALLGQEARVRQRGVRRPAATRASDDAELAGLEQRPSAPGTLTVAAASVGRAAGVGGGRRCRSCRAPLARWPRP